jgi:integrase
MSSQQRNKSPWVKEEFEKTNAFSKAFDQLQKSIIDEPNKVSVHEKIVRIIVSAICRGGLAKPTQITQLINRILQNTLELKTGPIAPYVELKALNENDAGNSGFLRWFIDTETLAAIHALTQAEDKKRIRLLSEKSLYQLVKTHFSAIPEVKHLSSLKTFCTAGAMYTMEHPDTSLPAYLVNFATGKTQTTSVSQSCWDNLWQSAALKSNEAEPLTIEAEAPRSNPSHSPRPVMNDKNFLAKLRFTIRDKDEDGVVIKEERTQNLLNELVGTTTALPQIMLVAFFKRGIEKQSWRRSSANTYLSHLGTHWFAFTKELNLPTLDEYNMTELFEHMLSVADGNISQSDKVSILKQFFVFGAETFELACPVFHDVEVSKVHNVSNYVISEHNFMRFINSISTIGNHQTLTGQGLILTAIIIARCGLRPSEVLKLRLRDVEPSAQHYIFIRQNQYGTNKSYSARRKIPLSLMLPPDEFELFKSYLKRRQIDASNQHQLLLFSSSANANLPYSLSDFYNKFSERLSEVCGEHVYTYHLRHKALSTLQLVLTSNSQNILTPYSEVQIKRIRGFFSVNTGRDALYELAAFAGHLSPETTFNSYLHYTDVILHENLATSAEPKQRRYWENLSGLSKHIITRRCSSDTPRSKEVELLLLESLCGKAQTRLTQSETTKTSEKFVPPQRKVTYVECVTALKYIDSGATISEISDKMTIEDDIVDTWYRNAASAAQLKTTKGKPRLFPAKANGDQQNVNPVTPTSKAEQKRAELAIESIRQLYKTDPAELMWFIRRVITTALNSHSYLQFDNIDELRRFMTFARHFTHTREWMLEVELPKEDRSGVSVKWKNVDDDLIVDISQKLVLAKKFVVGRAYLHFLHPRKGIAKEGDKAKRYSSNVIKYVCHILAIMLPSVLEDVLN